ncbi:hypothetical protein FPQ18DRAFT_373034 [Pyronema domesticum]|nr:hypothetical protein FPQ18DRAFT_373034 [Pyronema domesticum]
MADKNASGSLALADLFDVSKFKCVVTGGGTGIGLMIVQGLAKNGATVYITGRRKEALDKVCSQYNGDKGKIIGIPCDITDKSQLQNLVSEIQKHEPEGIHLLVNNAGVAPEESTLNKAPKDMGDLEAVQKWMWGSEQKDWEHVFQVNVMAHYYASVAFLPLLSAASKNTPGHSPSIINISSISGILKSSSMGQFAYSSSKAAIIHLTKSLATSFKDLKIRVNTIAPGLFPSEMTERKPADDTGKNYLEKGERGWPAGRAGDEADIVGATIYLASTAGLFVNGQTLVVDGGVVLTSPSSI